MLERLRSLFRAPERKSLSAPADGELRIFSGGYRGNKQFVRLQLTKAGGTSIALGAVAVLGNPHVAPVA